MKRVIIVFLAAFGLQALACGDETSDSLDPARMDRLTANELVCRGGGDLQFSLVPFSQFHSSNHFLINFKKANVPGGVGEGAERLESLGTGECAFVDREVALDAPDQLLVTIGRDSLNISFGITWTPSGFVSLSLGIPVGHDIEFLEVLQSEAGYYSFLVNGRGPYFADKGRQWEVSR